MNKCDHQSRMSSNDFLIFIHLLFYIFSSIISFLLNQREQHSLLDYLKRDPSLPEVLVHVLSKLEESIAKLTDTVCVLLLLPFLGLISVSLQILFSHILLLKMMGFL